MTFAFAWYTKQALGRTLHQPPHGRTEQGRRDLRGATLETPVRDGFTTRERRQSSGCPSRKSFEEARFRTARYCRAAICLFFSGIEGDLPALLTEVSKTAFWFHNGVDMFDLGCSALRGKGRAKAGQNSMVLGSLAIFLVTHIGNSLLVLLAGLVSC